MRKVKFKVLFFVKRSKTGNSKIYYTNEMGLNFIGKFNGLFKI